MSNEEIDIFAVTARVARGGNRLLRIVAHVVCRDVNGQIRWEDDAVAEMPIPAGTEVPEFRCESTRCEIVAAALPSGGEEARGDVNLSPPREPLGPLAGGD